MKSTKVKIYLFLLSAIVSCSLLVSYAASKNGETIQVIEGRVQSCEYLGGNKHDPKPHATIKTETGSYVTALLPNCKRGLDVNILVKRGVFYFNSVFFAEKMGER
jgi:hypothetical protein